MSYFRSYFEKNNTIIKNSVVNTSKFPVTELFYGDKFSRFIFKINLDDLKTKISNGDYVLNNNTKHYLKLTNTIFGDESYIGQKKQNGKQRATSFVLELYKLTEHWDEGFGYDLNNDSTFDYNKSYSVTPSNWYKKDTLNDWSNDGSYNGTGNTITTINFDNGNEDIYVDITTYINNLLNNIEINYGIGLKFIEQFEILSTDVETSVSFFTKYTQTFFEPYVETIFSDRIDDDRNNFIEKKQQNLYLYVTKNGNFIDLDELPTVDVLTNNTPIVGLTGLTTTKIRKGIYKTTFGVNNLICDGKKFLTDVWKNVKIEGIELDDIKRKFIPYPHTKLYDFGDNITNRNQHHIQISGIQNKEQIKRGEIRKIVITHKNINNIIENIHDKTYYRIYILEGKTNVQIFNWTQVDKTNELTFDLDTSYLIPREYYIEFKSLINNQEIISPTKISFEIISEY